MAKKQDDKLEKNEKRWNIEVDQELCGGCGNCTSYAPEVFKIGTEGLSHVKEDAEINDIEIVIEAANNCPNNAIIITDNETGEVFS